MLHPYLSCRFRKNDRQLRYRRLRHDVFGDTLLAGTKSKRGNKCAKVFVTKFGWSRAFSMDKKGDAHDALSLLFRWDGVPPKMIFEGSKEQTLGVFKRKFAEAGCHLRHTEPESLWQMAAEGVICELKRGSGIKMTKIKLPKVLWDNCLELEAYIRSNTALNTFDLNGMTPETNIPGETSDKTTFCKFGCYQWVYFRDKSVTFPREKLFLGRYCGTSIDVGPALTAKILRKNGKQAHRSTVTHIGH